MRMGLAVGMLMLAGCGTAPKAPGPGEALLGQIESSHGPEARQRVEAWRDLVEREQSVAEGEKLRSVNAFVNRLVFVDDAVHWGREDYWATPLETLVSNGGDCEDFTIAKYYTLRSLRVPESRMRLTYVKSLTLQQPHMVLAYYREPEAEPLILDNLVKEILPASSRLDLVPVYSFNTEGLWLARQRARSEYVGDRDQVGLWREFLARLQREERDWVTLSPFLGSANAAE